jgi:hypothetical protein
MSPVLFSDCPEWVAYSGAHTQRGNEVLQQSGFPRHVQIHFDEMTQNYEAPITVDVRRVTGFTGYGAWAVEGCRCQVLSLLY